MPPVLGPAMVAQLCPRPPVYHTTQPLVSETEIDTETVWVIEEEKHLVWPLSTHLQRYYQLCQMQPVFMLN